MWQSLVTCVLASQMNFLIWKNVVATVMTTANGALHFNFAISFWFYLIQCYFIYLFSLHTRRQDVSSGAVRILKAEAAGGDNLSSPSSRPVVVCRL